MNVMKIDAESEFFSDFWGYSSQFLRNGVIGCREPRNPDIPAHTFHVLWIGGSV